MFGFNNTRCDRRGMRGFGPRGGGFGRGAMSGFEDGRGFGGGRGGMGGHMGGGGRRRMFDGAQLRLLLLALLEEQPRHGYDLIREIDERTGGNYAPSPGVVYPTLTMLDEMGHIDEVKEEGARKRFAISDAGRAHLGERREEVEALLARLAQVGERSGGADQAPVRRAVMSLHMALRETLSRGANGHDVAAILDEATRQIERTVAKGPEQ